MVISYLLMGFLNSGIPITDNSERVGLPEERELIAKVTGDPPLPGYGVAGE